MIDLMHDPKPSMLLRAGRPADNRPAANRPFACMGRVALGALMLALVPAVIDARTGMPAPASAQAEAPAAGLAGAPASFADLAAKVTPAVVNISSTHKVSTDAMPDMPFSFPPGSPFEDFFKQFMDSQQGKGKPRPRKSVSLGSGFIIDSSGYVVTNNHVVEDATEIQVTLTDGRDFPAKLVGVDAKTDLALLKVEAKTPLPAVGWGNSDKARVGDWVLAVGNPFGLGGTVTTGIVSARSRDINNGPYDDFLQIDAAINQGNSGGPTFDMSGAIIGINTAIVSPSGGSVGIGFAIPSNLARTIVAELKDKGTIARGWLGVQIQQVTPDLASGLGLDRPRGALVAGVEPGSPAEKAGIKTGDVILSFAERAVEDMRDLPRLVADAAAGRKVKVMIVRQGKENALSVEIGKMKDGVATQASAHGPGEQKSGANGVLESAALGARLSALTADARQQFQIDEATKGVLVIDLRDDSPLAEQGIRPGDVIERVGEREISDPADLDRLVGEAKQTENPILVVLVNRDGHDLFVAIKLKTT